MEQTKALFGAVFLLSFTFLGCDRSHPVDPEDALQRSIAIDLSSLHRLTLNGMQLECVSVVAEAVLLVDGRERARRDVPPGAMMIRFDSIEVDIGEVEFAASIFSNNNTLLYANSVTEEIEGDFQGDNAVRFELQKQDAVLQVCPGALELGKENSYTDTVLVFNRGSEALEVEVIPPDALCDGEPCLSFESQLDPIEPGASGELQVSSNTTEQQALVVQIRSSVGSVGVAVEVAGNQPPVVANPIADQALEVEEQFEVDLTTVFSDPDGDEMSFSATSSNPDVATASVSGSALTVEQVGPGTATVTVTADDGFGGTVQDAFEVTSVNQPPVVTNPIADQEMEVEEQFVIDLTTIFTDPDGDVLSFPNPTSSNPDAVTVSISGSALTVTAMAQGAATITVTADDGLGGTAQDEFVVTVNNQPPVVANPIPDQALVVEQVFEADLTTVFADPDGDALSFSATSSDPAAATASVSGSTLAVEQVGPGTATVTVTADDGFGGTAQDAFEVTSVNQPPVVANPIPDQALEVEEQFEVDLTTVFADPDGDEMSFSAVSSDPAAATASVSGSTLTVTQVGSGTATVTVTADDGFEGTAQDDFIVTEARPDLVVTTLEATGSPVYNPDQGTYAVPVRVVIENQGNAEAGIFKVATIYTRPDGNTFVAAFTVEGQASLFYPFTSAPLAPGGEVVFDGVVTFLEEGMTVTLHAFADSCSGDEFMPDYCRVEESDEGNNESAPVELFLPPANQPPEVIDDGISDTTLVNGQSFEVDLTTVFTDPDGDVLSFPDPTVSSLGSSSDPEVVTASISGSTLTVTAVARGTATVTVTADDGLGGSAEDVFTVTVLNQPPVVVNPLPNLTDDLVPSESIEIDLTPVFSDPDGDALTFSALSSDPAVATVSVSGSTLTVDPESQAGGTATITVTADDGFGGTAQDVFTVQFSIP